MSLPLTFAALETHVAQVGASLHSATDVCAQRQVAAELIDLRGEIGLFLDRHGIDLPDELWANLLMTMERVDGAIAWMQKTSVQFA